MASTPTISDQIDGSLWPLSEVPNEQKIGKDVAAMVAGRHEAAEPDIPTLATRAGMWPGMRVLVSSTSRIHVYLGAGAGQGWAAMPEQYPDIATVAGLASLAAPVTGDTVYCTGTSIRYRYSGGAWVIDQPITVTDLTALASLANMYVDQIVWVGGTVNRFYIFTGSSAGFVWQPLTNMVYDSTYGWMPRRIVVTQTVTLGSSGTITFTAPFGQTIVGAEKYGYKIQNANGSANAANVYAFTTPGAGSQTGITAYAINAAAGGCQLSIEASYRASF